MNWKVWAERVVIGVGIVMVSETKKGYAKRITLWIRGGPSATRTQDQRIKSPVLYQLS